MISRFSISILVRGSSQGMNRIGPLSSGILCVCLICVGILTAAPNALAEATRPALSIAVIDIQIILRDSKAMKGVRDQIEVQRKKFQAEITDKEKTLRADGQALEQQRAVLSPAAFTKKQRDLQGKVIEVQGQVQARRRQLDQAFSAAASTFQKTLVKLVAGLAKEKGYNLVISKGQIVHVSPQFDITSLALKRLDKTLPTVKVKVPAK